MITFGKLVEIFELLVISTSGHAELTAKEKAKNTFNSKRRRFNFVSCCVVVVVIVLFSLSCHSNQIGNLRFETDTSFLTVLTSGTGSTKIKSACTDLPLILVEIFHHFIWVIEID